MRETAVLKAAEMGGANQQLRAVEAAHGFRPDLWMSVALNTWNRLSESDRPRLLAVVRASEPAQYAKLVEHIHRMMSVMRKHPKYEEFRAGWSGLIAGLRETTTDPELRRLLDEAAAPK